jgi:hypothetical protein
VPWVVADPGCRGFDDLPDAYERPKVAPITMGHSQWAFSSSRAPWCCVV